MRLLLTVLGTAWVTATVVAYMAFGLSLSGEGQEAWWYCGALLMPAVAGVPFLVYSCLDGSP